MESRNYSSSKRERVKVSDEEIEKEEEKEVEEAPQSETVQLVLLRNLRLKYTGPISGKLYDFPRGGAILDIDKEDADIMLEKHGGTCCEGSGSTQPQPYFAKL
jgi:hypothetical protein